MGHRGAWPRRRRPRPPAPGRRRPALRGRRHGHRLAHHRPPHPAPAHRPRHDARRPRGRDRPGALAGVDDRERQPRAEARRCSPRSPRRSACRSTSCCAPRRRRRRAALEIELERAQRGPLFASPGHPTGQGRASRCPTDALEALVALHERGAAPAHRARRDPRGGPPRQRRAAAPRCARRTTTSPTSRSTPAPCSTAIDHPGGPLSQRATADIAAHLGFSLHYVPDLPHSTRTVTDLANGRIYLPQGNPGVARRTLAPAAGRSRATCSGTPSRGTTPTSCASASRRTTSPPRSCCRRTAPWRSCRRPRRTGGSPSRTCATRSRSPTRRPPTGSPTSPPGTSAMPVHFMKVHEGGTLAQGVRERRRARSPPTRSARSRGSRCAGSGRPASCSRCRRPVQPVLPVHRHPVRHVLVHLARAALVAGRVLGERRRAVRARAVVPRAGDDRTARRPGAPTRPAAGSRPQPSPSGGPSRPGRARARTRACSPPCPSGCSRASTPPRSTSSSNGTHRGSERRSGRQRRPAATLTR